MFVSRGSNVQPPAQVHQLQTDLRLGRVTTIATARGRQDASNQSFTHHELVQTKKGRDTAAGADGVTYSMLAHFGLAEEEPVLALINHSWQEGRLPKAWKAVDIQPLPKPSEPTKPRPISLVSCTGKTTVTPGVPAPTRFWLY